MNLAGKSILITGGTGSLGKALTKRIFNENPDVSRVVIYSRDEQKQFLMAQDYPEEKYPAIRFFIGDVRDSERLTRAMNGIDYVIHAAAMKHVHLAEYNPSECIKTNVNGAENIIHAALYHNVKSVVALSTDKACAPVNLYGATKLTSDKLFVAANNIRGKSPIKFSVVRYGNVSGSTGSILETLKKNHLENKDTFNLTDKNMTRFWITANQALEFVLYCLDEMKGGEIFIPKIPSIKIYDLVKSFRNIKKINIIGIKPGEKIHESMFTKDECHLILEAKKSYIISPNVNLIDRYKSKNYHLLNKYYDYKSDTNNDFLSMDQIKKLIEN